MIRRRWPSPWEAAQVPPPRDPVRRLTLAVRIVVVATFTRSGTSNG